MAVRLTADLTKKQAEFSPNIEKTVKPVTQGSTEVIDYKPTINQGVDKQARIIAENTAVRYFQSRVQRSERVFIQPWRPQIEQGKITISKELPTVIQGRALIDTYDPKPVNQGSSIIRIPDVRLNQGKTDVEKYNPKIEQGGVKIPYYNPEISQGEIQIQKPITDPQQGDVNRIIAEAEAVTALRRPEPVNQGEAQINKVQPEVNQGKIYIEPPIYRINQGEIEIKKEQPSISQGEVELKRNIREVEQGSSRVIKTQPEINQGSSEINRDQPQINQGSVDIDPLQIQVNQGSTEIVIPDPNIEQGSANIVIPNPVINQGEILIRKSEPEINQGSSEIVIPDPEINQGQIELRINQPRINQGSTEIVIPDPNIEQGSVTITPPVVIISQGADLQTGESIITPNAIDIVVNQGYDIASGTSVSVINRQYLTSTAINQGIARNGGSLIEIAPFDSVIINQGFDVNSGESISSVNSNFSSIVVNQGIVANQSYIVIAPFEPTGPNLSGVSVPYTINRPWLFTPNQGSITIGPWNFLPDQGFISLPPWNFIPDQGFIIIGPWNFIPNQGSVVLSAWNFVPNQGFVTLSPWNFVPNQGFVVIGPWNFIPNQGSVTIAPWNITINQGSVIIAPWNFIPSQGINITDGTSYILIGPWTPAINQGLLPNGQSYAIIAPWNITINQGSVIIGPWNPSNAPVSPGVLGNIFQGPNPRDPIIGPWLLNVVPDSGISNPTTAYQGSIIIRSGRDLGGQPIRDSIQFGRNSKPELFTLPIISQTISGLVGAPIPIIGNASISGVLTGTLQAAGMPGIAQAVSAVNYLANLPLTLYKRPEGLLLIGNQVANVVFSHFMTRKDKYLTYSWPDESTNTDPESGRVNTKVWPKKGLQGVLATSNARYHDVDSNEIRYPEFWKQDNYFFIDKFKMKIGPPDQFYSSFNLKKDPFFSQSPLGNTGQTLNKNSTADDIRNSSWGDGSNDTLKYQDFFKDADESVLGSTPVILGNPYERFETIVELKGDASYGLLTQHNRIGSTTRAKYEEITIAAQGNFSNTGAIVSDIGTIRYDITPLVTYQSVTIDDTSNKVDSFFRTSDPSAAAIYESLLEVSTTNFGNTGGKDQGNLGIRSDIYPMMAYTPETEDEAGAKIDDYHTTLEQLKPIGKFSSYNDVPGTTIYGALTYAQISSKAAGGVGGTVRELDDFRSELPSNTSTLPNKDNKQIRNTFVKLRDEDNRGAIPNDSSQVGVIDPLMQAVGAKAKDFIEFRLKALHTGDDLQFRAYLSGFSDRYNPTFADVQYIGRPNPMKLFQSVTRDISLSFYVVALSRGELLVMYSKLQKLVNFVLPVGNGIMVSPIFEITLGDYVRDEICHLTGLTFDVEDEFPWEVNIEGDANVGELPQLIKVTMGIYVVGRNAMSTAYVPFGRNFSTARSMRPSIGQAQLNASTEQRLNGPQAGLTGPPPDQLSTGISSGDTQVINPNSSTTAGAGQVINDANNYNINTEPAEIGDLVPGPDNLA